MTNAELIAKIKAEIERLKGIGGIVPLDNREQKTGYESALIDIETFLSTLESEKPVPNDLEEAANKFAVFYDQGTCDGIAQDCFRAGAEWQKEQYHFFNKAWAENMQAELDRNYENGKQAMKEQMMKEAVEGEVVKKYIIIEGKEYSDWLGLGHSVWDKIVDLNWYGSPYKGKQIRVIIVKED